MWRKFHLLCQSVLAPTAADLFVGLITMAWLPVTALLLFLSFFKYSFGISIGLRALQLKSGFFPVGCGYYTVQTNFPTTMDFNTVHF